MTTITKQTGLDFDIFGHDTLYIIDFEFEKQKAKIEVEVWDDEPSKCRIVSCTDGYHWLHFWLSQEPNCSNLLEQSSSHQILQCMKVFASNQIQYIDEAKDSAWLTLAEGSIDQSFIEKLAKIIEPRFALREKFFDDEY